MDEAKQDQTGKATRPNKATTHLTGNGGYHGVGGEGGVAALHHTYIHTYIYTYIHTCIDSGKGLLDQFQSQVRGEDSGIPTKTHLRDLHPHHEDGLVLEDLRPPSILPQYSESLLNAPGPGEMCSQNAGSQAGRHFAACPDATLTPSP